MVLLQENCEKSRHLTEWGKDTDLPVKKGPEEGLCLAMIKIGEKKDKVCLVRPESRGVQRNTHLKKKGSSENVR